MNFTFRNGKKILSVFLAVVMVMSTLIFSPALAGSYDSPYSTDCEGYERHNYDKPVWTWADNYSTATATFICTNNPEHSYQFVASYTNDMLISTNVKEPTCTETGLKIHSASVRLDGVTYTDNKEEVIATVPHITVHTQAEAASCTSDGVVENWYCNKCKTMFANADCTTVITTNVDPMIQHDFTGSFAYIGQDEHARLCSYGCGTKDTQNALSCPYTNWTLTRATEGEAAYYTKSCPDCLHEETVYATKANYEEYNKQIASLDSLLENDRVTAEDKAMINELIENNCVADDLVADTDDLDKGKLNEQDIIDNAANTLRSEVESLNSKYFNFYAIEFVDYDGKEISFDYYRFGNSIVVPADPTRKSDGEFDYTFSGWDKQIPTYVTGDETFTATYDSTYIEYTVEFLGRNSVIASKTYHYGDDLVLPTEEELESASYTEKGFTYLVKGWTTLIDNRVVKNTTYTAVYNEPYDLTRAVNDISRASDEDERTHYEHEKIVRMDEALNEINVLFEEYGIDIENEINPVDSTDEEFETRLENILAQLEELLRKYDCTGHNYVVTVTEPTCLAMGFTKTVCSKCKDEIISDWKEILPHDYKAIISEPTCTEKGFTTHICTKCKSSYIDSYVDCIPHDFVSVVTAPTCTKKGYTTNTCTVCGTVVVTDETEIIPHDYVATVTKPTCQHGGYTGYKCSMCGDEYYDDFTDITDHNYIEYITEPNCTQGGYTTFRCEYCGDEYVGDQTQANGHSWTQIPEKAATCGVSGHSAYNKCSVCNEVSDYVEYPALEHSFRVTIETTASDGSYSWRTYICQRCGDKFAIITLIARDENGDPVANAKVTILDVNNTVINTGKTEANGHCTPNINLYDGTYTVIVEETSKELKAEGVITVTNGAVSGDYTAGTGRLHFYGTPVTQPEENETCTCNCHKTGISNFMWKISNFFHKLFGMESYRKCKCGAEHW